MSYLPISGITPQYSDPATGLPYSGVVLKAYADGTSTNISFATDTTGGTLATSIALNSNGFPEVSSNVVIPHLDQDYKLSLYPTQAAADANSGAIWTVDNIPITDEGSVFTATETGTGDAYEISLTLPTGVLVTGQRLQFVASEANVGACTLNVNALGATSIKLLDGTDPYDNAIVASMIVDVQYDGTNFQLHNPSTVEQEILDSNGNEILITAKVASAVNEVTVTNAATGNGPDISATGTDTNIDITLTPKGTGRVLIPYNGALVYHSTTQSLTSSIYTHLAFDSEDYDTDTIHDTSTNNNRLTVSTGAQRIRLTGYVIFDGNVTGTRIIGISKNDETTVPTNVVGLPRIRKNPSGGTDIEMLVTTSVVSVTGGDYFTLYAFQDSGVALNVKDTGAFGEKTYFSMEIIE